MRGLGHARFRRQCRGGPSARGALSGASAAADDLAVLAIGQGAYGALRTAAALGAARMLLVSPRCRAQDDDVPADLRDEMACEGLPAPDPDRLRALAPAGLRGLVLHDPFLAPRDRAHAAALGLAFPGLRVLAMPFGGHPALRLMAAAGLMDRVLGALLGDRLQPGVFRALHREARARSGRYARLVERYRDRRGLPPGPELAVL
ncbi:hypothetical protein [Phaeovulum vinaykumarii]|nr:hypothetical protein [Phaeovulum vinaykumarii]